MSFKTSLKTSLLSQRFNINKIYDGNIMNKLTINMAIFDNSQKNFSHKNLFSRCSGTFPKLTSLIFIESWTPISVFIIITHLIKNSYNISQKIISSPYMPMFDTIKNLIYMVLLGLSSILHLSDPTVLLAMLICQERGVKNI